MSQTVKKRRLNRETMITSFDRVSAWITATTLILGTLVTLLFLIWLMTIFTGRETEATAIQSFAGDTGLEAPEGEAEDLEEPGVVEFPEIEEPQLTDALESLTDAVSTVQAQLEKVDGSQQVMGKGSGLGHRDGGGDGGDGTQPWDRWNVEYSNSDIATYAQQLTFFGIEIGVVSQSTPRIDIISNLSATPLRRVSSRRTEKRVHFSHASPKLQLWDQELARRAGIDDFAGRYVIQFYPDDVTQTLTNLERQYASSNGKQLSEVLVTVFMVRASGNGFEYYVESMQ